MSFPTDEAVLKSVYRAIKEATKKWTMLNKTILDLKNQPNHHHFQYQTSLANYYILF
jgi:transposase-like protein